MEGIGKRVAECLGRASPPRTQREVAAHIGIAPDAFSSALKGERRFSAGEVAALARLLGVDVHWLITGEPDPMRVRLVARHAFDHAAGRHLPPDATGDAQLLDDVALAYRQAYPAGLDWPVTLPHRAAAVRAVLDADFIPEFAERLEMRLGIDVVRLRGLSTAWSFTIGGRPVIVLPSSGNWFRDNWSLAHETAHLCLGHHQDGSASGRMEMEANAFAAELLLPAEELTRITWSGLTDEQLADLVWNLGVSIDALWRRVSALGIRVPTVLANWSGQPTQRLLRRHWSGEGVAITRRMDHAAARRFPLCLQEKHVEKIKAGEIGLATLAWMLDVEQEDLGIDRPSPPRSLAPDELDRLLGG